MWIAIKMDFSSRCCRRKATFQASTADSQAASWNPWWEDTKTVDSDHSPTSSLYFCVLLFSQILDHCLIPTGLYVLWGPGLTAFTLDTIVQCKNQTKNVFCQYFIKNLLKEVSCVWRVEKAFHSDFTNTF